MKMQTCNITFNPADDRPVRNYTILQDTWIVLQPAANTNERPFACAKIKFQFSKLSDFEDVI
jgi:hypothetical protein